ncbi:MAG: ABC transporter ATP-binding protein [Ardenticatenaceae bacterium]|nr:ABC transporter ATP-binding protein [Ardenticatenaceae bacterium]
MAGQVKNPTHIDPPSSHILRRCYSYLRPYWRLTAGAYLTMLGTIGLALAIPQFIRWIVDNGIEQNDSRLLGWSILALLGLTLVKGFLSFWENRWTEVASQGVAYDLRNALHRKLTGLSFAYHDRTETGQLLSRTMQDTERIRFLTGRATLRLAEGVSLLLGTALFLLLMNPRLALLTLATMPLLAYQALRFGRQFRPLSLAIQQQLAVLTTRLEQNLRGARIVKAFAQETAEIARFDDDNDAWFNLAALSARLQAYNMPLLDFIANIGTVFIIWYGGTLVIHSQLTLGELVAFSTYMGQLIQPVRRLGMIIPAIAMASASGERIFEVLDAESPVQDAPDAYPLPPITGRVTFEHVHFAYTKPHRVLHDISFEARPGQIIALLGATGSGKSTITNLIPRFYDPSQGRICLDGHDIRHVTLASLRAQIGIVLQETTLFAATIGENIAFGRPGADQAAIEAVARAAQAHDFILAMPKGYDTPVGERGATLSGGQKQRVAIARTLLKDPRILILDDATSSVDTETEGLIQQALHRLMQGRTSFIIAQRLSTVRMADLILVLEDGRIATAGTHATLLRRSPLYARIYEQQLRPENGAEFVGSGQET